MHMRNLEHKMAEFNLALQPDLIIMDGRKAFVSGRPGQGRTGGAGFLWLRETRSLSMSRH